MMGVEDKKGVRWLIHVIGWGILFGLPFFFIGRNSPDNTLDRYLRYCVVPFSLMIVFYVNYVFLIDRYLFKKQVVKYILWNILLIAVVGACLHYWQEIHMPAPPPGPRGERGPHAWHMKLLFVSRDLLSLVLTAGLSVAIKMTYSWYRADSERQELEKSKTEAELKNLKSQLNPHFLFNTLNNIYSLIAFSPDKAQQAVQDLSKLLRYVLYEDNQRSVPLEKEIAFIRNYVELMLLRVPNQVKVTLELPELGPGEAEIAPLLFISLIENAFKHGVSSTKPSYIHIKIEFTGDKKVVATIENSYFPKNENDKSGSGIGIGNLRRRLELIYPDRYILHTENDQAKYVSMLAIFLNEPL